MAAPALLTYMRDKPMPASLSIPDSPSQDTIRHDRTSGFPPEVFFGVSAEGFPVARVGVVAYAMIPTRSGKHYLATALLPLSRPMAEWTQSDFFGHSGNLADETEFHAKISELAEHHRERTALNRKESFERTGTPWGISQSATIYAEGVTCYSTAGHGGFKLSAARNRKVDPVLRVKGGWYEEDADWAIVAISFPDLFTAFERRHAEKTVKDHWPDAWEAIFGRVLLPGESVEKDRRAFETEHANDWMVTAAINSKHNPGFVETVATIGGRRDGGEQRRFLVPSCEYNQGRFGFVIDLSRHLPYEGPSDFIG